MPALDLARIAADYRRDGFAIVRGVIDAEELAELRADVERVVAPARRARLTEPGYTYAAHPETGQPVLQRIDGIQGRAPACWRMVGHPGLLAIGRAVQGDDLLGCGQALVMKTPGWGAPVHWHRDPAFCRVRHGCNIDVYLDDADAENGMLWAIPGSHRRRTFVDLPAAIERHGFELPGAIPVPVRAGDVIVHCENVLHGSPATRSARERRVIYFGMRSVAEQLARGCSEAWVAAVMRLMHAAIADRAAHRPRETPFALPLARRYPPAVPGQPSEPPQHHGDVNGDPRLALPFEDDALSVAR